MPAAYGCCQPASGPRTPPHLSQLGINPETPQVMQRQSVMLSTLLIIADYFRQKVLGRQGGGSPLIVPQTGGSPPIAPQTGGSPLIVPLVAAHSTPRDHSLVLGCALQVTCKQLGSQRSCACEHELSWGVNGSWQWV